MMLFKTLVASAFVAAAAAQGGDWATYTAPAAAVQTDFKNPPAGDFTDAKVKRDYDLLVDRNTAQIDPYECWSCGRSYNYWAVPQNPKCNGNNCYRAFLDGRSGSPGLHCPSNAMFDCCYWYTLCENDKFWFVYNGWVAEYAPWTSKCGAGTPWSYTCNDDVKTVVDKIDEVCACTIRHTITVDADSPYVALRKDWPNNPACSP